MQLHEEYRPKSWDEVVGQSKVVARIEQLRQRGLGGRSYWLSGQSGTGKTTVARLLAAEVAEPWAIDEVDAQWLTPARIADLERQTASKPIGGGGWSIVCNESHGLTSASVRQLLVTLERVPSWVCWIFTTTTEGEQMILDGCQDSHPLLSRCIELPLSRRGLAEPFAERCREIAVRHGLDGGATAERFVKLLQACKNNCRMALQRIDAGELLVA